MPLKWVQDRNQAGERMGSWTVQDVAEPSLRDNLNGQMAVWFEEAIKMGYSEKVALIYAFERFNLERK